MQGSQKLRLTKAEKFPAGGLFEGGDNITKASTKNVIKSSSKLKFFDSMICSKFLRQKKKQKNVFCDENLGQDFQMNWMFRGCCNCFQFENIELTILEQDGKVGAPLKVQKRNF